MDAPKVFESFQARGDGSSPFFSSREAYKGPAHWSSRIDRVRLLPLTSATSMIAMERASSEDRDTLNIRKPGRRIMATKQQVQVTAREMSREDEAVIVKKLEVVAKLREIQAENARINLELLRRGLAKPEVRCW
jgi:hypothetical protein